VGFCSIKKTLHKLDHISNRRKSLDNVVCKAVVLNRGGVKKFPGEREPSHALQHGKLFELGCVPSKRYASPTLRRFM